MYQSRDDTSLHTKLFLCIYSRVVRCVFDTAVAVRLFGQSSIRRCHTAFSPAFAVSVPAAWKPINNDVRLWGVPPARPQQSSLTAFGPTGTSTAVLVLNHVSSKMSPQNDIFRKCFVTDAKRRERCRGGSYPIQRYSRVG